MFCLGTGKSLIFSKIMESYQLKKQYDIKIQNGYVVPGANITNGTKYRHAILNEVKNCLIYTNLRQYS